jgi:soluble lytic murein transglycosylase-like protein
MRHRNLQPDLEGALMPDELEFGVRRDDTGYGVRQGSDRRHKDRRVGNRAKPGRRRRDRRRAGLRTLLLAAAALATSHSVKTQTTPLKPNVSVLMNSFRAVSPDRAYDELIAEAAEEYKLDPELIRAVMRAESAFNPMVVSRAGAQGLMQLMPALAEEMGVDDPFDPRQNIMGGARYLRWLLDRHRGNIPLSLASYNAGPTAVARYRGAVPPFRETRQYVKKITGFLADARAAAADDGTDD